MGVISLKLDAHTKRTNSLREERRERDTFTVLTLTVGSTKMQTLHFSSNNKRTLGFKHLTLFVWLLKTLLGIDDTSRLLDSGDETNSTHAGSKH